MKTYKFTTARGSKIEITAGDVTYKNEISLDGQATGVFEEETHLTVEALLINGTAYRGAGIVEETVIDGTKLAKIATARNNKGQLVVIQLPDAVFDEIYAGEAARVEANIAKMMAQVNAPSTEDKNLCPICHSYCYGDCEANK